MTIKLSLGNLPAIARHVPVPAYDRAALSAGILHIGVGNFHRAHQAVYFDDLFNTGTDLDWALVGSSVRESDVAIQQDLLSQDLLTTVVAQEADRTSARVTGSMVAFIEPANTAAILERLCDPAIRIVSLTITEGGYYIDPASQAFDATHPDIVADSVAPAAPKTAFGLILAALVRRRSRAIASFTVMSCDNLPGNGHVAENAVAGLANLIDPNLALWVREHVSFPNSMVDRITPATTARERNLLMQMCGIADARPVFCEEFRQWVLEDRFPAGRPALEKVGVQFVDDVMPFELMKIRILNGGHAAIAYPAALMDIQFAHEAMAEPLIGEFLARLLDREIIPIVPPVPGIDLGEYKLTIERRFANPKVDDTIRRLCLDGSNRQPKFILPSIHDRVRQGLAIDGLALVTAFWCRYCYGETESGAVIAPNDPSWGELQALAKRARQAPREWLGMSNIFGDLAENPTYVAAFSAALERVWREGTRSALRSYLAGGA